MLTTLFPGRSLSMFHGHWGSVQCLVSCATNIRQDGLAEKCYTFKLDVQNLNLIQFKLKGISGRECCTSSISIGSLDSLVPCAINIRQDSLAEKC